MTPGLRAAREYIIDLMGEPGALLPSDKTVAANSSETDVSPKSSKTEQSSSFVSSTQSSPSSSTHSVHSTRSDMGDHGKDRKDAGSERGTHIDGTAYIKLDSRHHSEPVELQGLDGKPSRHISTGRISHYRSPSWTEGMGMPGGRQMKDALQDMTDVTPDVSQMVINAAKENPQLLQKLQEVLLESGVVIQDISPKPMKAQVVEDKKLEDEERRDQEKCAALQAHPPKKKGGFGPGRPPIAFRPPVAVTDEGPATRERLQRLDSVEGLGDRRPLESLVEALPPAVVPKMPMDSPPVEAAAPAIAPQMQRGSPPIEAVPPTVFEPLGLPAAVPAVLALPVAVPIAASFPILAPLPVVATSLPEQVGNSGSGFQKEYIRHVPVAAAAAAAATAAVVASTMVAAAARGEGGGDPRMEVPIAAAATATAAVVAATSAVAGKVMDSNESSPVNSDSQPGPGSGHRETRVEELQRGGGSGHRQRQSDERRSEPGGSTHGSSHMALGTSGDGLDGEISVEEERNSENLSRNVQKRYDAVLADVAEWEIPWEDIIIGERIGLGIQLLHCGIRCDETCISLRVTDAC